MSEIDLHAIIRRVCDESPSPDPAVLAKEVADQIPKSQAFAALQQALPAVIRQVLSSGRSSIRMADTPRVGKSWKVAAVREAWAKSLHSRIAVGEGEWKFLADCTSGDLVAAAEVREVHARRNIARAEQFRRLAQLLEEAAVDTVGELEGEQLASVLGEDVA